MTSLDFATLCRVCGQELRYGAVISISSKLFGDASHYQILFRSTKLLGFLSRMPSRWWEPFILAFVPIDDLDLAGDYWKLSSVWNLEPTWSCPRVANFPPPKLPKADTMGLWASCPATILPCGSLWKAWTGNYRHQDWQLPQQRRPFQKTEEVDQVRWTSWSGHQRLWWLPWYYVFLDVVANRLKFLLNYIYKFSFLYFMIYF